MMWWVVGVSAYVIVGYFFARWFVGSFLDDGKWADTHKPANPLVINLVWGSYAVVFAVVGIAGSIAWVFSLRKDLVRRFYGLDD